MKNCVNLLCLKANISIEELALLMGITRTDAYDICAERVILTIEQVNRLCEIFNATPNEILCRC